VSDRLWRLAVHVPKSAVEAFEGALGQGAWAVASFEIRPGSDWLIEILLDRRPDATELRRRLVGAAALLGIAVPRAVVEPVESDDWVTKALRHHPPVRAGRFYVHGSHAAARLPAGALPILIDAAQAFGTGHHESTRGCLLALDHLAKAGHGRRHVRRKRVLDMGCGSGVLAIAAWKLWRGRPLAVDIDPKAVEETRRNAKRNGCGGSLRARCATGFQGRAVMRGPRFDVVTANILARPLSAMATALARRLAPGGRAILAGLLSEQATMVEASYRARRVAVERRIALNGWTTLVLRK